MPRWKTAKALERGRGKGFACQVPCSTLLQGEVAVARELGSRAFHTGGFRNPLPSLPWPTAAPCCISLSLVVEPPRAWGSSLHLAMHVAPGPGWAISWGVCVLYTFLPTTMTTGLRHWLREQKGSVDSPPLVIHHLSQRFPECSPLTTGDFGRTSKVR